MLLCKSFYSEKIGEKFGDMDSDSLTICFMFLLTVLFTKYPLQKRSTKALLGKVFLCYDQLNVFGEKKLP